MSTSPEKNPAENNPESASAEEKKRNDTSGTADDTLGENTEETPLAQEINHPDEPEKQSPSEELE